MEIRVGRSIPLVLFGMPFLAGGLFVLYAMAVHIVPQLFFPAQPGQSIWPMLAATVLLLVSGGMFTAAGWTLAFAESGLTLDKEQGTFRCWWSYVVCGGETKGRIGEIQEIVVRESHSFKSGTSCWLCLALEADREQATHQLAMRPKEAQRMEAELRRFLDLA